MRKLKLKRKKRRFSKAFLRLLRNIARGAALAAGIPAIALIGAAAYFEAALPDVYYAEDPSGFSIRQYRVLTPSPKRRKRRRSRCWSGRRMRKRKPRSWKKA